MTRHRDLIRPVLLLQTGVLALSTVEATVTAVAGVGSPVPALLTAAATAAVGTSARTGRYTRPLRWTERIIVVTFVIDTVIALFTASSLLEPMAWISRLAIPVFVLRSTRDAAHEKTVGVERRAEVAA